MSGVDGAAPGAPGSAGAPAGASILIVDDNPENGRLAEKILSRAGYSCAVVTDAFEGYSRMKADRPALVLLDMSMPGMDGWEFATKAKADPEARSVKIMALTAHAMKDDRARALEAGCDAYMSKPFRSAELLVMIREMLNG